MKKLLGIVVLGLLLSGNAYADKIYIKDVKIDDKLTKYLSLSQIEDFNVNDTSDIKAYSYDGEYSAISIRPANLIFQGDYDYVQIEYRNKDKKIKGISGVIDFRFDHSAGKEECMIYRDQKILLYEQKKLLLEMKKKLASHKYSDGSTEERVNFENPLKSFFVSFYCVFYPNDDNDFRFDYNDKEFYSWLAEQWQKH